jgi:hypothetical protein
MTSPTLIGQQAEGTAYGINRAGKLGQDAVTERLHDLAAIPGNARLDVIHKIMLQGGQRASLVSLHEPRVAHDVRDQNCCQTARNLVHAPALPRAKHCRPLNQAT